MCGRFTLRTPVSEILEAFQVDVQEGFEFPLRYNVAPTQEILAVRSTEDGRREFARLRWGLIPFWAKEPSIGNRMINARAESLADKPAFRQAFRHRRCLIVADGFYEWQKIGKRKQPYYLHRPDGKPFAFAGLWEKWPGMTPPLLSGTIITTDANATARPIHDRMPVILEADQYARWLDPQIEDPRQLEPLLKSADDELLRADPVSTHVNNVRHEDPRCVEVQRTLFD